MTTRSDAMCVLTSGKMCLTELAIDLNPYVGIVAAARMN